MERRSATTASRSFSSPGGWRRSSRSSRRASCRTRATEGRQASQRAACAGGPPPPPVAPPPRVVEDDAMDEARRYELIEEPGSAPVKAWIRGVPLEGQAREQGARLARVPFIHGWVAAVA